MAVEVIMTLEQQVRGKIYTTLRQKLALIV